MMRMGFRTVLIAGTLSFTACDSGAKPKADDAEAVLRDGLLERTASNEESLRTLVRLKEFRTTMCSCTDAACAEHVLQAIRKSKVQEPLRVSEGIHYDWARGVLREIGKCLELGAGHAPVGALE